jgi:membrane fusion protein (multidrug efflux system)
VSGRGSRGLLYLVGGLVVLASAAGTAGFGRKRAQSTRQEAERRQQEVKAGVRAFVVPVRRAAGERRIDLQGEARPYASVTLYAKVSGYLKEVRVDRGDRVRAGQVLATIRSPELDRQYESARADATVKRANARRAESLAGPGAVSVREADLEKAGAEMAEATVAAIGTQRDYTVLRAPFAGTITARYADVGALLQSATGAQTGALPVVTVADLERLRVLVYVDQRDAAGVRVGDTAEVQIPFGGGTRRGGIARASGELDSRTRTMPVEIVLDNRDHKIVAGSFVTVRLLMKRPALLEVPAEALVLREQKPFVALVGSDGRVKLRSVSVAEHDGGRATLEEGSGLGEGDLIALNLGRSVSDGDLIDAVTTPAAPPGNNAPAK